MEIKTELKYGIIFGFIGFTLTFLFWYLTTGTFDWRFPATIGVGFFGGGFFGAMLKELYKIGEEKKANLIMLIIISLLMILQIYLIATEQIRGPTWRTILTGNTIIGCIFVGYAIILLVTKNKK